jgi:hypothetical protein
MVARAKTPRTGADEESKKQIPSRHTHRLPPRLTRLHPKVWARILDLERRLCTARTSRRSVPATVAPPLVAQPPVHSITHRPSTRRYPGPHSTPSTALARPPTSTRGSPHEVHGFVCLASEHKDTCKPHTPPTSPSILIRRRVHIPRTLYRISLEIGVSF